jgi:RNA polymerase sigma-70 factor (ECF subfamily)
VTSSASRAERFTELYHSWWPYVRRTAHDLLPCNADAEDAAQRVFLRLWKGGAWKDIANPKQFFRKAARNEAFKTLRRRRHRHLLTEHQAAALRSRDRDIATTLIREESWGRLQELLLGLPRRCAALMTLTILHGMTRREAAKHLDITVKAVEKQVTRCHKILTDMPGLEELHEMLSTLVDGGGKAVVGS